MLKTTVMPFEKMCMSSSVNFVINNTMEKSTNTPRNTHSMLNNSKKCGNKLGQTSLTSPIGETTQQPMTKRRRPNCNPHVPLRIPDRCAPKQQPQIPRMMAKF